MRGWSGEALAFGEVGRDEKGLHERPLAADDHAREAPIPVACGDFSFGVEPRCLELSNRCRKRAGGTFCLRPFGMARSNNLMA